MRGFIYLTAACVLTCAYLDQAAGQGVDLPIKLATDQSAPNAAATTAAALSTGSLAHDAANSSGVAAVPSQRVSGSDTSANVAPSSRPSNILSSGAAALLVNAESSNAMVAVSTGGMGDPSATALPSN